MSIRIPVIADYQGPRLMLDGGCYVFSPDKADWAVRGDLHYTMIIGEDLGARFQSQFYLLQKGDTAPVASFGDRGTILMVARGAGQIIVSGRTFSVKARDGLYVRPGEAFSLSAGLDVFVSPCPAAEAPEWLTAMPDNFDATQPNRLVEVDRANWSAMAERAYQVLVDKSIGCTMATQFIGSIPLSKAEPHRHLYEEALIILTGQGFMWTQNGKAAVRGGDVIFLPRKQIHYLQCTNADGMDVVGIIYPGDNPSINY